MPPRKAAGQGRPRPEACPGRRGGPPRGGEGERRPRERRLTPRHPAPARGARSRSRRGGGARRRRGACASGVGEEGPHDGRVLHDGDDPQPAPTAGTGEDIEGKHAVHQRRPGPRAPGAAGAGRASAGSAVASGPGGRRARPASASAHGKPLHSTERSKPVTVHYRWHPLYGQMARVRRGVPRGHGELLFCELPDGTRGALPSWMTDAAACAALTAGTPVVAIAALQELRGLLDAVGARGSEPTGASMLSKEGCDAPTESVDPHPGPAVPARRVRAPDRAGRPPAAGADPGLGRASAARGRRFACDGTGGRA